MEFKVGDLVSAKQWTRDGDKTCLGMIVARNTSSWKVDWYGIEVEFSWYTPYDIKLFRNNYLELCKAL
jgi:hypothetical protein